MAVVLGHAVASGIGALIQVISNFAGLLIQGRGSVSQTFPLAWRATLMTGPLTVVLWLIVSVVTLLLIHRIVRSEHHAD